MFNYIFSALASILVIVLIIVIFITVTVINMKTKKPDDCINENEKCDTCLISCIHNANKNKDE